MSSCFCNSSSVHPLLTPFLSVSTMFTPSYQPAVCPSFSLPLPMFPACLSVSAPISMLLSLSLPSSLIPLSFPPCISYPLVITPHA
jgi:hypothetical protein